MIETIEWRGVGEGLPESGTGRFCFVEVLVKRGDRVEQALFNTRTRNFQIEFIIIKGVERWCYPPTGCSPSTGKVKE